MKRLYLSCNQCRRALTMDFDGDVSALEPIISQTKQSHPVDDFCRGEIVTAIVDSPPPGLADELAHG